MILYPWLLPYNVLITQPHQGVFKTWISQMGQNCLLVLLVTWATCLSRGNINLLLFIILESIQPRCLYFQFLIFPIYQMLHKFSMSHLYYSLHGLSPFKANIPLGIVNILFFFPLFSNIALSFFSCPVQLHSVLFNYYSYFKCIWK